MSKPIITDYEFLCQTSLPVTEFDQDLKDLVSDMVEAMIEHQGIGLSAVQIGVLKRVIIAYDDNRFTIMINPEFIRKLNREVLEREGCLSIPGFRRLVSRPAKCEVRFQDLEGNTQTLNCSGMLARIVQHEEDHLNGILISDKPRL